MLKFGSYVDSVICILIFVNDYNVNEAELCLRLSYISFVYLGCIGKEVDENENIEWRCLKIVITF